MAKCRECNAYVADNAKQCPNCGHRRMSGVKKRAIILILIFLFIASIPSCISGNNSDTKSQNTQDTAISNAVVDNVESDNSSANANNSFTLIAGEAGKYGEKFKLNDESYYVYRVPSGTYNVTNVGKYPNQFNVYGDKVYITDNGYEELSDTYYVKVLMVNESDTVTVEDGQIIEINGPAEFLLEPVE